MTDKEVVRKNRTSDDCVSREAVIDTIIEDEEIDGVVDGRKIIEHIRKLPPVTPTEDDYEDKCATCSWLDRTFDED